MFRKLLSVYQIALIATVCLAIVHAQQAQVVPAANDLRNGQDTIRPPSSMTGAGGAPGTDQRGLMPLVDVDHDKENNQSKVDVHVPIFFDMTNLNNPDKSKLDLSVLHGLVTVQKDKERDQNGQMNGPMKVTVFGIPVYTSKGNQRSGAPMDSLEEPIRQTRKQLDDTITRSRSDLNNRAEELTRKVNDQVQSANQKLANSLADFMNRMSTILRGNPLAPPSANTNEPQKMVPNQQVQQQSLQQQQGPTQALSPMNLRAPITNLIEEPERAVRSKSSQGSKSNLQQLQQQNANPNEVASTGHLDETFVYV